MPVPRVHWCCGDASVLGAPFFLMDRLEGETLPRRLLRDPEYATTRAGLAPALGAILARIHAIDTARPELAGLATAQAGVGSARQEIRRIVEAVAAARRRAAPGARSGRALARGARARAAPPRAGARRLPRGQRDVRRERRARDPRLGARAPGRSGRGSGLAVRARLALRQRRAAGGRRRNPRAAGARLRGRRRAARRSRGPALLGGVRELQARARLHHAVSRLARRRALARARLARPAHGRGRAGAARADGGRRRERPSRRASSCCAPSSASSSRRWCPSSTARAATTRAWPRTWSRSSRARSRRRRRSSRRNGSASARCSGCASSGRARATRCATRCARARRRSPSASGAATPTRGPGAPS